MGTDSEREETTEFAINRIQEFIDRKDYPVLVLFSAIYAEIRLSSLYTDELVTPADDWNELAKKTFDKNSFNKLIDLCEKSKKLASGEKDFLTQLRIKRNNVAHTSRLWRNALDVGEDKEIESLGRNTIKFLKRTKNK